MASVEAALNTDIIEQSQVDALRNAFSAELASFMVASETDGPQGRVAQAVENIAEGVHAVGERAQAFGDAVTQRKALLTLETGSLALLCGGATVVAHAAESNPVRVVSASVAQSKITWLEKNCLKSNLSVAPGVGGYKRTDPKTGATISTTRRKLNPEEHRRVNVKYPAGYTYCGGVVLDNNGKNYFPAATTSKTAVGKFVKTRTGGYIVDPFTNHDTKGRNLMQAGVWIRKKKG